MQLGFSAHNVICVFDIPKSALPTQNFFQLPSRFTNPNGLDQRSNDKTDRKRETYSHQLTINTTTNY